jgi:ribonuclease-3
LRELEPARAAALDALARRLAHRFADPALLDRALTHASYANEAGPGFRDNEALEFLGDAVLGLAVSDLLHRSDPEGDEGSKTRMRAHLVSERSLARHAESLGLPGLLRLGRGEEKTGGRHKTALWADGYEAVVAALFLDGGFEAARRFVEQDFGADIAELPRGAIVDHKSALQEMLQAHGQAVPEYALVGEVGPSHRRLFRIECRIAGRAVSMGEGHSKKEAQQEAARTALALLRG